MTTMVDRYASRGATRPSLEPRLDPVVHGEEDGPLDGDLLTSFEDDGYITVRGLFAPTEVEELNRHVAELVADPAVRGADETVIEPDSDAVRSVFAFHRRPGPLAQIASDGRLAAIARQLLGSDVYIHQSRVNLKPGFRGREFAWHSDFETWHAEDGMPAMRAVSCVVSLTDNHPWNGPLLVMAGSHLWFVSCAGETPPNHHEESLRRQEIGVPDEASLTELADRSEMRQCTGAAGTVVFFDCNLMHGSNSNISPDPRRNLFLVFNSVENTLVAPFGADEPRPEYIASRSFDAV